MDKDDIQLLFKYNQWSNARVLCAASKVTNDQFLAPASFPHGGLRGTLAHILFAEWIWRSRWEGHSPTTRLKADEFPTFGTLRSRWLEEEHLLMAFVRRLTDGRLVESFEYASTNRTRFQNILWHSMVHVVNHGTQHRSEAAALLTGLGYSPGDIDLIFFVREQEEKRA